MGSGRRTPEPIRRPLVGKQLLAGRRQLREQPEPRRRPPAAASPGAVLRTRQVRQARQRTPKQEPAQLQRQPARHCRLLTGAADRDAGRPVLKQPELMQPVLLQPALKQPALKQHRTPEQEPVQLGQQAERRRRRLAGEAPDAGRQERQPAVQLQRQPAVRSLPGRPVSLPLSGLRHPRPGYRHHRHRREPGAAPFSPWNYPRFASIALTSWGTTVKRSPTTPKSAISKMGASASLLIAMMVLAVCMPARCWMAPEMPSAM